MRILPLALAAFPLPALAESFTVESMPTAVTVYSGFAMVTREVSIDVPEGSHEVILPDLPQWIDAGSLRASIGGASLTGTRLRTDALPPAAEADSAEVLAAKEQIEQAQQALVDLDDAVQDASLAATAAAARLNFLQGLTSSESLPTTPQALAELAEMIEAQTLVATQTQITAQRDIRDIEQDREELQRNLDDARAALAALTPPAAPKSLLALSVSAADAGTIVASVSYPVQASWQPTYDVLLSREGGDSVALRRAALITQNSGENWDDVSITLSTLTPSGQVMPSELYPQLLRFEDPQVRAKVERSVSSLAGVAADEAPVMIQAPTPEPNFDGPGVSYSLPTPVSVAQDAEGVRIELDTLTFDARVFARAVPVRDTTAFLMAEVVNASQEPLLAANSAQIFVDGSLVGQSGFSAVAAGESFSQAFGPIESLRLSHAILDKSEGDRGIISRSNAQTQEVQISVQNLAAETWDVELREAIPFSEQDDLVIDWSAQPAASSKDVEDRRGLMQWEFTLGAEQSQEILIEQTVRWPDGKVLR